MNCHFCRGKMEKKTAHYNADGKGYHLLLDAVPAWVCSQCGEAYFEEAAVESIQSAIQAVNRQAAKLHEAA